MILYMLNDSYKFVNKIYAMNIIILILIALGCLTSPEEFTDEYINRHPDEINHATTIYENNWYKEVEGGVIIDDEVNP